MASGFFEGAAGWLADGLFRRLSDDVTGLTRRQDDSGVSKTRSCS